MSIKMLSSKRGFFGSRIMMPVRRPTVMHTWLVAFYARQGLALKWPSHQILRRASSSHFEVFVLWVAALPSQPPSCYLGGRAAAIPPHPLPQSLRRSAPSTGNSTISPEMAQPLEACWHIIYYRLSNKVMSSSGRSGIMRMQF